MLAKALGSGKKSFLNASVTVAGPPPPPAKVGTIDIGSCGVTFVCDTPNCCNVQAKGSWTAAAANISTLAECVARAKSCSMANFVSFSKPQNDCSWYKECDMQHLIQPPTWQGHSEVIHEVKSNPATAQVFALPWIRHDSGARGVLLINKAASPTVVLLKEQSAAGAGGAEGPWHANRTTAVVLDGSVDGVTVDAEPGFVPPVERRLGADGSLPLGPFAVAVVQQRHL